MAEADRPRSFELLVYGLVLVLAAFLATHALKRAFPARWAGPSSPSAGELPPASSRLVGSGAERSVSELPPLETSKDAASSARDVPAPPAPPSAGKN